MNRKHIQSIMSNLRERILKYPHAYQIVQDLIGGTRARQWTIQRYVDIKPGQSVLDLGCGPGDLLRLLPQDKGFQYVGIDLSKEYLQVAEKLSSPSIRFLHGDCTNFLPLIGGARFDWILCMGLLHHISDRAVESLLAAAARSLTEEGSVVCLEPTLSPDHSWFTKATMSLDRGEHIRYEDAWRTLFEERFHQVSISWLKGAFRIPYEKTVCISRNPKRSSDA
jgi:SAM-dependent methyltransferase